MATDNRLSEAAALAAACADSAPAARLTDLTRAIAAGEAELAELHKATVAAANRINRLTDLKKRITDLQKFGPGSAGALPDWARKNDAVTADLRSLSTATD